MNEQVSHGVSNIVLPLPNPPIRKGRGLDSPVSPLCKATVYTQVIESPPNPQNGGNRNFQSPPKLGNLGGEIGRNEDR